MTPITQIIDKIIVSLNLNQEDKTKLNTIIQDKIAKNEIEATVDITPELKEKLDGIDSGNNKMKTFEMTQMKQYTPNTIKNFNSLKYNLGKLQVMILINKIKKATDNSVILDTMLDALNSTMGTMSNMLDMNLIGGSTHDDLISLLHGIHGHIIDHPQYEQIKKIIKESKNKELIEELQKLEEDDKLIEAIPKDNIVLPSDIKQKLESMNFHILLLRLLQFDKILLDPKKKELLKPFFDKFNHMNKIITQESTLKAVSPRTPIQGKHTVSVPKSRSVSPRTPIQGKHTVSALKGHLKIHKPDTHPISIESKHTVVPIPEHTTAHTPEHQPEHIKAHTPEHQPEHIKAHTPEHKKVHTPEHKKAHTPEHKPEHIKAHTPEHQPEHTTAHAKEHIKAHTPEHKKVHTPEHTPEHKKAHTTEHTPAHTPVHTPAHTPAHTTEHTTEHTTAHTTAHAKVHTTAHTTESPPKHTKVHTKASTKVKSDNLSPKQIEHCNEHPKDGICKKYCSENECMSKSFMKPLSTVKLRKEANKNVNKDRDKPHDCSIVSPELKARCEIDNVIRPHINNIKDNSKLSKEDKIKAMERILSNIQTSKKNKFSKETQLQLSTIIQTIKGELNHIFSMEYNKDYIKYIKYKNKYLKLKQLIDF